MITMEDEVEKEFSEDEDGNLIPVVRVPLSDLMFTDSSFLVRGDSRVFRSRSSDTTNDQTPSSSQQHSSHSSQEPSSSWKTTLPTAVSSWNPVSPASSLNIGMKQASTSTMTSSNRPSTLDSESAQFAVSAIDAYNTGVTSSQVTSLSSLHHKNSMIQRTESNPLSSNLISNGPATGRNNLH